MATLEERRKRVKMAKEMNDYFVFGAGEFNLRDKKEIGRSSFGTVYAVDYTNTGTKCALKVIKGMTPEKECLLHMSFDNDNIIRFFGCLRYKTHIACVLEFAQHGSLYDVIVRHKSTIPINFQVKMNWIKDITAGLVYLHHELNPPVYHGDIKSMNVLICSDKNGQTTAKLADFGLSRMLQMTTAARGEGTPFWQAPEVYGWEKKSLKSDIWSYGATVTEVFTERFPYHHVFPNKYNADEILLRLRRGEITPLTELSEEDQNKIPPIFRRILPLTFKLDHHERWTILKISVEMLKDSRNTDTVPAAASPVPSTVRITVRGPDETKKSKIVSTNGMRNWAALREHAGRLLQLPVSGMSVTYNFEVLYHQQGDVRRAVRCYDDKQREEMVIDVENGRVIEEPLWKKFTWRLLSELSAIPSAVKLTPQIDILRDCHILQLRADGNMKAAPSEELFNCSCVLLILGMKSGTQRFWETARGFCEGKTGVLYRRAKDIPSPNGLQHFLLLLRSGDRIPKVKVPEGEVLFFLTRAGTDVSLRDGCISATISPSADQERWEAPCVASAFQLKLSTACARQ